jgi:predicted alpha/beta superfamily hydrolase
MQTSVFGEVFYGLLTIQQLCKRAATLGFYAILSPANLRGWHNISFIDIQ